MELIRKIYWFAIASWWLLRQYRFNGSYRDWLEYQHSRAYQSSRTAKLKWYEARLHLRGEDHFSAYKSYMAWRLLSGETDDPMRTSLVAARMHLILDVELEA